MGKGVSCWRAGGGVIVCLVFFEGEAGVFAFLTAAFSVFSFMFFLGVWNQQSWEPQAFANAFFSLFSLSLRWRGVVIQQKNQINSKYIAHLS